MIRRKLELANLKTKSRFLYLFLYLARRTCFLSLSRKREVAPDRLGMVTVNETAKSGNLAIAKVAIIIGRLQVTFTVPLKEFLFSRRVQFRRLPQSQLFEDFAQQTREQDVLQNRWNFNTQRTLASNDIRFFTQNNRNTQSGQRSRVCTPY